MIDRAAMQATAKAYGQTVKVGVLGSHSALDVCDGAKEEGLTTVVFANTGRHLTYDRYFRTTATGRGIVDECHILDQFAHIDQRVPHMIEEKIVFVPNRSLVSYMGIDRVEDEFPVPMFGSRHLLRSEERGDPKDYYWLLREAGLPHPPAVKPEDIDSLTMIKVPHAVKGLERGFFTASSYEEYLNKSKELIAQGVITQEALEKGRKEKYIIGPVFNLNFFRSPLAEDDESQIELLGIDWRFETSLDGHVRLPASQQMSLNERQMTPEYVVCGHNSATLRESLLEKAFKLAEDYVQAVKDHSPPDVVGPFCLQTCVDKDLRFYIYDIAPRVGGGTNVHMAMGHPYGNALWRKPMSTGRRIAMEIRRAAEQERLDEVVS